jgi:hypothetical protein
MNPEEFLPQGGEWSWRKTGEKKMTGSNSYELLEAETMGKIHFAVSFIMLVTILLPSDAKERTSFFLIHS